MLNQEKFTTAEERVKAFYEWVGLGLDRSVEKFAGWLSLEAEEEKPEPCPFCGKEVVVGFSENIHREKYRQVWCSDGERCGYECVREKTEADAIAAHNRVARAVRAEKKSK